MKDFTFTKSRPSYDASSVFFVRVSNDISVTEYFIESLQYLFWNPNCENISWSSFEDWLCDLNSLPCCKVVVFHEGLPTVPDTDLKKYIASLQKALNVWEGRRIKRLEVVFFEENKLKLETLLNQA